MPHTANSLFSAFESSSATTRRLTKIKHYKKAIDIVKLPKAVDTKKLVSMDKCKEMMSIEREFGSCLVDDVEKDRVEWDKKMANKYWNLLYQHLGLSNQKY